MLKLFLPLLLVAALPVTAETLSKEIGRTGLGPTETRLLALSDPSEEDRLALGAVQFLHAIEGSFQTRWTYGMTDRTGMLPFLRLGMAENPAPKPFEAQVIAQIFSDAEAGLAQAITTLTSLPDDSPAALELSLADLWFDIDQSGNRVPGEGLVELVGAMAFGLEPGAGEAAPSLPTLRFDRADAAWAAAYAHALSGFSQTILAYDPTEPVGRILAARQGLAAYGPPTPSFLTGISQIPDEIDIFAMVLASLQQQPNPERMAKAHDHFLQMIAENRRFWSLVEKETDNDREWLPNARQVSGLGLPLPPETAQMWQAVLAEAEAALTGKELIPYWRAGDAGGINLKRMFLEPAPIDLPGWIQGWAALPYMEKGPLMTGASWSRFESMLSGDAMLFALWLN